MAEFQEIEKTREQLESTSGDDVQHQKFEDGVTMRTVVGALFVGFIMMPGAMYLGLVAGQGLGAAAQWVTVVLFAEIARRSFQPLKKQELYMLVWIAGGLAGTAAHGLAGGPFSELIWRQYLVQSPQIGDLAQLIPTWVAPRANDPAIINRTFFSMSWLVPILLIISGQFTERMIWIGGGYAVFRLTSDIERLPFPMAPIAAAGATALAEAGTKEESWRWQVFSTGTVIGVLFGLIYLFIPIVTSVLFGTAVQLIPLMFIDFTANTERVLPAAWAAISGDLGSILVGFVIPYPIVVGSFIGSVLAKIGFNPILYHMGLLPSWTYGMTLMPTKLSTSLDFWLSFVIGTGLGVGFIGLATVTVLGIKMRGQASRPTLRRTLPPGRGDWNIWLSIAVWFFASCIQVTISHILVPGFPWYILAFYGLLYTPIITYVSARLIGITGFGVGIPMLREATILTSGYKGADIWFAQIPMHDLGGIAQRFREVELTGTKFTSVIKIELLMLAIMLPTSFFFWSFFWKTSPIPSAQFPYTFKFWPNTAVESSIWWTANAENAKDNFLLKAIKPWIIAYAGIGTLVVYGIFSIFKLPLMFFYGFVGGCSGEPTGEIPKFIGALLGRYYFRKRFGEVRWAQYAPVLIAGFGCGMGLSAMTAVAVALITKSVNYLPF